MTEINLEQIIRRQLRDPQKYNIGFADMAGLLSPEYQGFQYAVVLGRHLEKAVIDQIADGPTAAYYALYQSVNQELDQVLTAVVKDLAELGIRSQAINATKHDAALDQDYEKTLRTNFSHKMVATRAGLGWIGKTDLFISSAFGPRLRLASLLVDYPLADQVGTPIIASQCGECQQCVLACPAQAANGKSWQVGVDRDEFYNAQQCLQKCRELSMAKLGKVISICGICVAVCPQGV